MEKLAARYRVLDRTRNDDDELLGQADVIVVRSPFRITRTMITHAPRLGLIIRAGSGLDNVDLCAARALNISVHNTPLNANAVAEHALALLLSLMREIPRLSIEISKGQWNKHGALGREISGRTAVVVGFGRIGRRVSEILSGFGCSLVVVDPSPHEEEKRTALRSLRDARCLPLDCALVEAELLFLCCPGNSRTRHLINESTIARMPRGAVVINVSRGSVVDTSALESALRSGHLGGACLDVHEPEPPGLQPILRHPKVVATPHVGAQTVEAQMRIANALVSIIQRHYPE